MLARYPMLAVELWRLCTLPTVWNVNRFGSVQYWHMQAPYVPVAERRRLRPKLSKKGARTAEWPLSRRIGKVYRPSMPMDASINGLSLPVAYRMFRSRISVAVPQQLNSRDIGPSFRAKHPMGPILRTGKRVPILSIDWLARNDVWIHSGVS